MAIGATFGRMLGIMVKAMYTYVQTHRLRRLLTYLSVHEAHTRRLVYSNSVLQMCPVSLLARMHSLARLRL